MYNCLTAFLNLNVMLMCNTCIHRSWSSLQLPVCHRLLAKSCDHMCDLVKRYVSVCLEESKQLTGILVSTKCLRTSKVLLFVIVILTLTYQIVCDRLFFHLSYIHSILFPHLKQTQTHCTLHLLTYHYHVVNSHIFLSTNLKLTCIVILAMCRQM